jgi:WD40-like Beta Propeller Repeat
MHDSKQHFLVAAAGFAVVAIVSILMVHPSLMTAQPAFSDWGPPHLVPGINSTDNDSGPALSKNRLSLYFSSNRPGGQGMSDIWVSQRDSVEEPWGPPINLGAAVNSIAEDNTPNVSRDGHWLYFMSRRAGSLPNPLGIIGFDIWVSYREHVHDDFDWQPPVHLDPPVNSPSFDQSPFFFDNEDIGIPMLFFTRTTPSGNDIFFSNRLPDGTFGPVALVPELNTTAADAGASVRFDGLEVFLYSRRPGGFGNSDLWTATRNRVSDPWSTPVNLGALVNSVDLDFDPHIDSSRETLYFASTRAGVGGQDLYMTTRTKQKGKP